MPQDRTPLQSSRRIWKMWNKLVNFSLQFPDPSWFHTCWNDNPKTIYVLYCRQHRSDSWLKTRTCWNAFFNWKQLLWKMLILRKPSWNMNVLIKHALFESNGSLRQIIITLLFLWRIPCVPTLYPAATFGWNMVVIHLSQ